MSKSNAIICTLFEGHYHFEVAALVNSLYNVGWEGSVYAGYRGAFIAVLVVGLVSIFPNTILLILGDKYQGLQKELIYMTMANCAGLLVGVTYSMSISRGIILSPVTNILSHVIIQITLAIMLDLSKTTEILLLVLADHCVAILMLSINFSRSTLRGNR